MSSYWSTVDIIESKYRNSKFAITSHSLKCCSVFVSSWFWASLFNFDKSIAVYSCIFVITELNRYVHGTKLVLKIGFHATFLS